MGPYIHTYSPQNQYRTWKRTPGKEDSQPLILGSQPLVSRSFKLQPLTIESVFWCLRWTQRFLVEQKRRLQIYPLNSLPFHTSVKPTVPRCHRFTSPGRSPCMQRNSNDRLRKSWKGWRPMPVRPGWHLCLPEGASDAMKGTYRWGKKNGVTT